MTRTVLAFYSTKENAFDALRELRQEHYNHVAAISRTDDGSVKVVQGFGRRNSGLLAIAFSLCCLAVGTLMRLSAGPLIAVGLTGVVLIWMGLNWLGFQLNPKLIRRAIRYVLPGEGLVIIETKPGRVTEAKALLNGAGNPTIFVLRRTNPYPDDRIEPERREPLSAGRLKAHAAELAAQHRVLPPTRKPHLLIARELRESEATLESIRDDLAQATRLEQSVTNAAEWLLDNGYIIRAHIADIRRNLPKKYFRVLPVLVDGNTPVALRIYTLADHLISHTDARLTEANITEFLDAYQTVSPLAIAELWVFPLMLRLVLIRELRRLAERVNRRQHERELADFWANRQLNAARRDSDQLAQLLQELKALHPSVGRHFAARLTEQLHDDEATSVPIQKWLEERLQTPLVETLRLEQSEQAFDQVSISNAVGSLRQLSQLDFKDVFERVSRVEAILRTDPAGIYTQSDFQTRDRCRRVVEDTSRYSRASENDVAQLAIQLAQNVPESADDRERHVGYYLLDAGRASLEDRTQCKVRIRARSLRSLRRHATGVYIGSVFCLTMLFLNVSVALAYLAGVRDVAVLVVLGCLASFPASQLALQAVHTLLTWILPPAVLPKLSLEEKIPDGCRTLVVIPMMLLTPDSIRGEVRKLEVRYLANRADNLYFSLLSDFTDAPAETMREDNELLKLAITLVEDLNARHHTDRFLLFHRRRRWCESEQLWMGWERKRGKLEELNQYLNGDPTSDGDDFLQVGNPPEQVRFVITLDSDTQLPHGSARRLIETIAHPLNRVELDETRRIRKRGYGIIQPRVSITLPGATATRFTRLFTDTTGTDPYGHAVSDVYQDLFGEGVYHGKAIYDVRAFHRVLGGRFPEQTLLSHDLLEGSYVGVGLATDIELFEQFPYTYPSFSKRQHRWIRGDWQIGNWIFPRVPSGDGRTEPNPLSLINRWKLFDNLRRSLVLPASTCLLVASWLLSEAPAVWSELIVATLLFAALIRVIQRSVQRLQGNLQAWNGASSDLTRPVLLTALLPHQSWVSMDAVIRALYRRLVSHRHLLQWETAEMSHWSASRHIDEFRIQMLIIFVTTGAIMIVLFDRNRVWAQSGFPYLAMWLFCPVLLHWIETEKKPRVKPLTETDRAYLRNAARGTWRYFDDYVGPETNWLPPDNFQAALRIEIAHRTSPTNIGLWLMSAVSASDLGYLTPEELVVRCTMTMDTLAKVEHYEGHLLNWYDTRTMQPLQPRYVSTVDSGNLMASLWVLIQALEGLCSAPVLGPAALMGLTDTLQIVEELIGNEAFVSVELKTLTLLFDQTSENFELIGSIRLAAAPVQKIVETLRWSFATGAEPVYWVNKLASGLLAWTGTLDRYLGWAELLAAPPDEFLRPLGVECVQARRRALSALPSLRDLANSYAPALRLVLDARSKSKELPNKLTAWLDELEQEFSRARSLAADLLARTESLIQRVKELEDGMNLAFLYDADRGLFTIGYSVGGPRDLSSHYDLLASEARLTSLVAIAKGEVPIEHWLAMGRPYTTRKGQVLLSWSGTMFEYMMPVLFTRAFENSLLDNACRQAVARQIEYGKQHGIPWGISESAFSALDANQTYQYRAFGVPDLGLKRGLEDDLVVAPYATALALPMRPQASVDNLRRLAKSGLRGKIGFYESIDYTREADRRGDSGVVIYAYFAHHQGMSLMAFDNALNDNVMQRRFHADLRVRAIEPLLFERIPSAPSELLHSGDEHVPVRMIGDVSRPANRVMNEATPVPRAHLLGNGRYSVMLTNSGAGYSCWHDFDITRWRADTTRDHWGSFFYVRDIASQLIWSTGFHPVDAEDPRYSASFSADRVEFRRRHTGIETVAEVIVSPEDDAEIRRISVTNASLRARRLEVTSFAELALAPHNADRAHSVFSKMFIQTEVLPDRQALIAWRRPRSPEEPPIWAGVVLSREDSSTLQYETDRAVFIGRLQDAADPERLRSALTDSAGTVLDPAFCIRQRVVLRPRERAQIAFITVAGDSRDAVLHLIDKYRDPEVCNRAFELAWTHAQLEFRYLGIQAETAHRYQELASHLLYPNARLRVSPERLSRNQLGQSRLWAHGLSGDLPIMLVEVEDERGVDLAREALLAHTYWRLRGYRADLVILNEESASYEQPLHDQLQRLIQARALHTGVDKPGGIFLRNARQIPDEDLTLIFASARVILTGNGGPIARQLSRPAEVAKLPPLLPMPRAVAEEPSPPLPFLELPYFNGLGGFTKDGREYAIYLAPDARTPLPWINVMANPTFGALVSEAGPGVVWYGNSQTNRLTPWQNDPISVPCSEALYLSDDETGSLWTPTPLPVRERDAYRTRHAQGYTEFEHNSHGLEQLLLTFVPIDDHGGDPIRIQRLKVRNSSGRNRKLTITHYVEWTLGVDREDTQAHIHTTWDAASHALLARNPWNADFSKRVAFAAISPAASSFTADRTAFLGRNGSLRRPAALEREYLQGRVGAGLDPCAALQFKMQLEPGEEKEMILLLGEGDSVDHVRALIARYQEPKAVENAFVKTKHWWNHLLETVQVDTPVLSVNLLLNRWLLYQTLSCRIWGRSAFYQSGGAFGFRDQLQDVMALMYARPHVAREQILLAAGRQFREGDVQHWWHPPSGAGIRSRCSDDLLWLPYITSRYVQITGDTKVLDERVKFLEGPLLKEDQHELYFVPAASEQDATVFEHCRRAIEKGITAGPHHLPLMGTGDWNDGMNEVGKAGTGESVWLAWFLIEVLKQFSAICDQRGEAALSSEYRMRIGELAEAVENSAWDGEWYRRAYFDDGTPLGSKENTEAKIDSLPQSWAVISGAGRRDRADQALRSATDHLVREAERMILLFTPPFDHSRPHPGYIMGYPPGVRENGGQYTHGALWLALAFARQGNGTEAVRLLQMLNPIEHTRTPEGVARYMGEPYVAAADVYELEGRVGRSGWTWYTGSSGWMYRVWLEDVLGFKQRGEELTIEPALPADWDGYTLTYRYRSAWYEIKVENNNGGRGPAVIELDGKALPNAHIPLRDDGARHVVRVQLGVMQPEGVAS